MPSNRPHPGIDSCRPLWVETSAAALRSNYAQLQHASPAPVLAVVKANAYGHGAGGCAPVLAGAGASWLGVTDVCEGIAVRRSLGILPQTVQPRILVMCGIWPGDQPECLQHGLTPVVWDAQHLHLLQAEAARRGMPPRSLPVHLEIDTGMARQGVTPGAPLAELLAHLAEATHLRLEGVLTHFSSAECIGSPQTELQSERFLIAARQIQQAGFTPQLIHAGNTSGIDTGLEPLLSAAAAILGARAMTRAGLALYGHALPLTDSALPEIPARPGIPARPDTPIQPGLPPPAGNGAVEQEGTAEPHLHLHALRPALTWKTRIGSLRTVPAGSTVGYNATFVAPHTMRLALLPVGYADGFRRDLSSTTTAPGAAVLVRGRRAPLVGRVSMDLSVVDVTGIPDAAVADEAVLLGAQGTGRILPEEHAALARTSVYEILCGIGARVPRIMVD